MFFVQVLLCASRRLRKALIVGVEYKVGYKFSFFFFSINVATTLATERHVKLVQRPNTVSDLTRQI